MVLKITRFFEDSLNKQAKISHWNADIKVGTPARISQKWADIIKEQFGELFLNDANYIVLSQVDATDEKKQIKKFSELVGTVLNTKIDIAEVKKIQPEDDEADDSSMTSKVFIKITTK